MEFRDANKPETQSERTDFIARESAASAARDVPNIKQLIDSKIAPKPADGKIDAKEPANIQGNAQRTSAGHAETSQQIANEMAGSGEYKSVHLNQSLGTITQGAVKDARRPDVAGVTKAGSVTVVEIPSASQSDKSQQTKVDSMVFTLGPLAGPNSRIEPVRVTPPPPPPPPKDPITKAPTIP